MGVRYILPWHLFVIYFTCCDLFTERVLLKKPIVKLENQDSGVTVQDIDGTRYTVSRLNPAQLHCC